MLSKYNQYPASFQGRNLGTKAGGKHPRRQMCRIDQDEMCCGDAGILVGATASRPYELFDDPMEKLTPFWREVCRGDRPARIAYAASVAHGRSPFLARLEPGDPGRPSQRPRVSLVSYECYCPQTAEQNSGTPRRSIIFPIRSFFLALSLKYWTIVSTKAKA